MHKTLIKLLCIPAFFSVAPLAAETVNADILLYQVQRGDGADTYLSRIMVSAGMLRMDEIGDEAMSGYTLFDRKQRLLLGVDPESRSVMQMASAEDTAVPGVDYSVTSRLLEDAPAVAGKSPVEFRYTVRGEDCFRFIAVEGVMADAMQALREMSTLLAERHRRVMATTDVSPGDCKLPLDAFAPGQEFSKGLLLSLVSDSEIRQLVDFRRDDDIDSALFEAPPGFGRFEMP